MSDVADLQRFEKTGSWKNNSSKN